MPTTNIRTGLSLAVVPDSWIENSSTAANHGGTSPLEVGFVAFKAAGITRAPLKFDLNAAGILSGAVINSAQLDLNATTGAVSGESARVNRITQQGWVEGEVTWDDYKSATAWSSAGGDFTATDEVTWTLPTSAVAFSITGLATLAQDAIDNQSGQLHLLLKRQTESSPDAKVLFSSGEDATEADRPTLVVDYTPAIPRRAMHYYRGRRTG